jgi:cytoskeleton protein RodZ
MPSFGENLRREREMRSVSLEEISAATKISLRLLQALEAEDFSALPGGVFTRSFIRTYAKYLGLDEEPVLAEYQLAGRPEAELDINRMSVSKATPEHGGPRAALVAVLLASVMLGGSYLLYRYSRPAAEAQGRITNSSQVSAAPPLSAPESNQASSPAAEPGDFPAAGATETGSRTGSAPDPSASANPSKSPVKPPDSSGDLVLQVAATEQAWVAVSADGKTSFQRILNSREFKTLKAKQSFDVVTGNAQGIVLTLNGETLNPLGGHNVYKKIHLTRDDLKNPAP